MGRFRDFVGAKRKWIVLCICLCLSLTMMFMGDSTRIPFAQQMTTSIFAFGQRLFIWAIYLTELHTDNVRLYRENARLSLELQKIRELNAENDRLRNLIGLREKIDYPYMAAMVIAIDMNRISNAVILNRGRMDDIRKNMPVVTAEGLVGRVSQVFRSQSSVQLLTDVSSRVSAVLQNDEGKFGIVRWDGGEGSRTLKMDIPLRIEVRKGNIVVTSGVGQIYPGGLKIGEVVEYSQDKLGRFNVIDIKPYVNPEMLRVVFIILDTEKLALPLQKRLLGTAVQE